MKKQSSKNDNINNVSNSQTESSAKNDSNASVKSKEVSSSSKFSNFTIDKFFFITALVMGILFSIIFFPEQAPDETNHIMMIEQEIGTRGFTEDVMTYYSKIDSTRVPFNPEETIDFSKFKEHIFEKFTYEDNRFTAPSPLCVRHLPADLGFLLGIILHLPIFFCLQLTELFAVIFFAFIGKLAIKLAPTFKELLCAIMLLPITLQQCSSVNYDAVLLPLCFLSVAYLLHFIYGDYKVKWKDILFLAIIAMVIVVTKPPYVLVMLMAFLIPKNKWDLKIKTRKKEYDFSGFIFKYMWIIAPIFIVLIGIACFMLRNSSYGKPLTACLTHPGMFYSLIKETFHYNGIFYIKSSVFVLGYLDTYAPIAMYVFIYVALLLLSQRKEKAPDNEKIKRAKLKQPSVARRIMQRILPLAIFCVITVILIVVMINWTFQLRQITVPADATVNELATYISQIIFVEGVQGRYFLPMLPLIFLVIGNLVRINDKAIKVIQFIYYPVLFIWTLYILINRFWI